MYFISFLIILLFIFAIYFAFFYFKKNKKLSRGQILEFQKILKKVLSNISTKEKIIDLDKLYHKILMSYWYKWSFWEILKQNPNIINDINSIWELHKLRNKLAHDFDLIEEKILIQKVKDYTKEVEKLIKNIS